MNEQQQRIAIIEDDPDLLDELLFFLEHRNYQAWGASSAEQFWKKLHVKPADIVLVDVGLPGEDGFGVVDYLQSFANLGVIIVTARGHQQDKLRGLNLGADLYLVKPVNFSELVSAIDRLWQRMQREHSVVDVTQKVREPSGQWWLISSRQCLVTPGGAELILSSQEYKLISTLGRSPSEVFNRETLINLIYPFEDTPDAHRINVILSRLRKKARTQNVSLPIRSIFGKGLVFVGTIDEKSAD